MAKHELAEFIIHKVFDPVLQAKAEGRPEADGKRLRHVQDATRAEIARYRGYASDQEVLTNFKRDLHSRAAEKVHAELRHLGLPTVNDITEEVEELAGRLGH